MKQKSGGLKQKEEKGGGVNNRNAMGENKGQNQISGFSIASLNTNESITDERNVVSKSQMEQKVISDPVVVPVITPVNTMSTTTSTSPPTKPEAPTVTVTPIPETPVASKTIETVNKEEVTTKPALTTSSTTTEKNTSNNNPMEAIGKFVEDTTHGIMENFHKLQDSIQSMFGGSSSTNTHIQKKEERVEPISIPSSTQQPNKLELEQQVNLATFERQVQTMEEKSVEVSSERLVEQAAELRAVHTVSSSASSFCTSTSTVSTE